MISGNMVGSYSQLGKTLILLDDEGNELTGIVVDQETVFTAGDNDVREGMVYASDNGVSEGTKTIPEYETVTGSKMIFPGDRFVVALPEKKSYDYTVFQCMISLINLDDIDNSVNTSMISFNNGVFPVNSTNKISDVSKDFNEQLIDLNISNDTDNYYFIHYFTYRKTSEG